MGEVTVAVIQLSSDADVARNVEVASELVREAASRGATYVQVPEYFNYLGPARGFSDASEPVPGPTTTHFARLAASLGVAVHLGSMLERSSDAAKPFNTSVVIDEHGDVVATYRKAHLFDVDVPGQITHRESDVIAAGDELVVVDVAGVCLGLSICFDLRFAELYRGLVLAGADVLAIPAAFNASTGAAHWEVLVRARAIENHAFVLSAAQVGTTSDAIATFGHSMVVDPWGVVVAQSTSDGPEVVLATIDPDDVRRRRSQIDVLALRRGDVYANAPRVVR